MLKLITQRKTIIRLFMTFVLFIQFLGYSIAEEGTHDEKPCLNLSQPPNAENTENNNESTSFSVNLPKKSVSFSGCGVYYSYEMGVAAYMQETFDLSNVVFLAASAGTLPATFLCANIPIRSRMRQVSRNFFEVFQKNFFGAFTQWYDEMGNHILPGLDEDSYKKVSGRLYISKTRLSLPQIMYNERISTWDSNQELVDSLRTSAFIPIVSKLRLYVKYKGNIYIDGGLTDNQPKLDNSTICIHPLMWRSQASWDFAFRVCHNWHDRMFQAGYEDATSHPEFWAVSGLKIKTN